MGAARLRSLRTQPRRYAAVLECQVKAGETPAKFAPARERVSMFPYSERTEILQYHGCVPCNGIFLLCMFPEAYPQLCRKEGYEQTRDDQPKGC